MVFRIYTKTGDMGETGLFGGQRVQKDHVRVAAYGDVDELNAVLGVAIASAKPGELTDFLLHLQHLLFELGAALATPPSRERKPTVIEPKDILLLEQAIDKHEALLAPLKSFILPGGSTLAATLHMARCVCRRAERSAVTLMHTEPETPVILITFLNRLSDLLFVLARYANVQACVNDVIWKSRTS